MTTVEEHNEQLVLEKQLLRQQMAELEARTAVIIGILMDDDYAEISQDLIDQSARVQISITENPDTRIVTLRRTIVDTDQSPSLNKS